MTRKKRSRRKTHVNEDISQNLMRKQKNFFRDYKRLERVLASFRANLKRGETPAKAKLDKANALADELADTQKALETGWRSLLERHDVRLFQ